MHVSRWIKFHRQFLALRHLPEVSQIGGDNGYTVGARQVSDTAASRRRGIWHDRDAGVLKQIGKRVFSHIAQEFDAVISSTLLLD
jgi:hypothetical protein